VVETEAEETAAIDALDGAEWMGRNLKVNRLSPRRMGQSPWRKPWWWQWRLSVIAIKRISTPYLPATKSRRSGRALIISEAAL